MVFLAEARRESVPARRLFDLNGIMLASEMQPRRQAPKASADRSPGHHNHDLTHGQRAPAGLPPEPRQEQQEYIRRKERKLHGQIALAPSWRQGRVPLGRAPVLLKNQGSQPGPQVGRILRVFLREGRLRCCGLAFAQELAQAAA